MAFNSEINTGENPNDGLGAGLRTNMRKLIENDNHLNEKKVEKVNGKELSSNDYTNAEKEKVANIENKVDKEEGKKLSANDYTDIEKEKLAGLEQNWENTANGNLKTKVPSKVAINKEEAEYALDIASSSSETILTGSASFDGFALTGSGTLFSSELVSGDSVLLADGQTIVLDDIMGDTMAYCYSGGNPTVTGTIKTQSVDKKLFNLQDVLQVLRKNVPNTKNSEINVIGNTNINRTLEGYGHIIDTITTHPGYGANSFTKEHILGGWSGFFQKKHVAPDGMEIFKTTFRRTSGTFHLILYIKGVPTIKIWEDGGIELLNLQTSPQGSSRLYKENGFLKIG
jgi:hypothetical protein